MRAPDIVHSARPASVGFLDAAFHQLGEEAEWIRHSQVDQLAIDHRQLHPPPLADHLGRKESFENHDQASHSPVTGGEGAAVAIEAAVFERLLIVVDAARAVDRY